MEIAKAFEKLKIDCKQCCGLCCVALYCQKEDSFPQNKEAGKPCIELNSDFTCKIHASLLDKKMKGCISYDCFGAGQNVTQNFYHGASWVDHKEMFTTYLNVYHLKQMHWYLLESLLFLPFKEIEIKNYIRMIEDLLVSNSIVINAYPIDRLHQQVNAILKEGIQSRATQKQKKNMLGIDLAHKDLSKMDFSMAFMMESNLQNSNLKDACFLGADMRNCNLKGADLSECFYLTQAQVNSCSGDNKTKLPSYIEKPIVWKSL